MSEIPPEDDAGLAKLRAIQSVMRDASLAPTERNSRMQEIMSGKIRFESSSSSSPSPSPSPSIVPAAAASAGAAGGGGDDDNVRTTLSDFEARVRAKSHEISGKMPPARATTTESANPLSALERRIAEKKTGSKNNPTTTTTASSLSSSARDGSGSDGGGGGGGGGENSSLSALERRIVEKATSGSHIAAASASWAVGPASTSSNGATVAARSGSMANDLDEFQSRILRKAASMRTTTTTALSADGGADSRGDGKSAGPMSDMERRIHGKVVRSSATLGLPSSPPLSSSDNNAAPAATSSSADFERQTLEKAAKSGSLEGGDDGANNNNNASSARVFEARVLEAVMEGNWRVGGEEDKPAAGEEEAAGIMRAGNGGGDEETPEMKKRRAIQAVMRDTSLDAHERNRRIQAVMAGNTTAGGSRTATGPGEGGNKGEKEEEETPEMKKRRTIQALMRDTSLDAHERNRRIQAVMAGNWRVGEEEEDEPAANEEEAAGIMGAGVGAGNGRGDDDRYGNDYDSGYGRDEEEGARGIHGYGRHHRPSPYDDDGGGAVGYGSFPRPEEHFPPSPVDVDDGRFPLDDSAGAEDSAGNEDSDRNAVPDDARRRRAAPQRGISVGTEDSDGGDGNGNADFGLAVATAVDADDEPDYVYNAIEFDPEAKPPIHRNRRFRAYTCLALLLVAIMVVLVVVYITSLTKADKINREYKEFQAEPTSSPSKSPITNREASGIIEQIEGGILYVRNHTFLDMEPGDPRLLALDWILHTDDLMLDSDDPALYQRYALAVLAYALDSRAWYVCGDPGENYTESSCVVGSDVSVPWLSMTSECEWYGVTCSGDGVVRAVDLSSNDLIGSLPFELYALRFVQLLALPHNCIYGTIPPEIGTMGNLLSLELHGNGLSGEMPWEIYDLENLQLLNLAEQWGGERECNATDGRVVDIKYRLGGQTWPLEENVGLTGTLGKELGGWRSMKGLYLNKNSFEGELTEDIGNLRYLRFLRLDDNFIAGSIPSKITKLKSLRWLQLAENFLASELPSDIGRLEDIERLTVNGNSMFGEIPNGLFKLDKLEVLRLDDTLMKEAPWHVVSDEGFTGSISTHIGNLQDLRWLLLNNNPMSGTIPTELGLCEKLEVIRVHRTNIEGTMPQEICALRNVNLNNEAIGVLYSDCRPNNRTGEPFLKCNCCSDCCDHTTGVCIADD